MCTFWRREKTFIFPSSTEGLIWTQNAHHYLSDLYKSQGWGEIIENLQKTSLYRKIFTSYGPLHLHLPTYQSAINKERKNESKWCSVHPIYRSPRLPEAHENGNSCSFSSKSQLYHSFCISRPESWNSQKQCSTTLWLSLVIAAREGWRQTQEAEDAVKLSKKTSAGGTPWHKQQLYQ